MIKVIVAIVRNPALTAEQFHAHWRGQHARLVAGSDVAKRYLRKYVQAHTMMSEYAHGEPPFDGVTELWFDSLGDRELFFSDPEYLATINPDEPRFADMTRTLSFVTIEEPIIEAQRR